MPVYFFDEAVFSGNTLSKQIWAPKGNHRPSLESSRFKFQAVAAASAIDAYGQRVATKLFEKSVDLPKFLEYLQEFRSKAVDGPVYFCLDNLPVHHCKAVKKYCEEKDIRLVYQPTYSSSFASIERLWAISK